MMAVVTRMEIQPAIMPGLVSENQLIGIDHLIWCLRAHGRLSNARLRSSAACCCAASLGLGSDQSKK
jgi:hypothetical protein